MVDIICLAKDLNICGRQKKGKEVSFFLKAQKKKSLLKTIETNCEWNNMASEKKDKM